MTPPDDIYTEQAREIVDNWFRIEKCAVATWLIAEISLALRRLGQERDEWKQKALCAVMAGQMTEDQLNEARAERDELKSDMAIAIDALELAYEDMDRQGCVNELPTIEKALLKIKGDK